MSSSKEEKLEAEKRALDVIYEALDHEKREQLKDIIERQKCKIDYKGQQGWKDEFERYKAEREKRKQVEELLEAEKDQAPQSTEAIASQTLSGVNDE